MVGACSLISTPWKTPFLKSRGKNSLFLGAEIAVLSGGEFGQPRGSKGGLLTLLRMRCKDLDIHFE